LSFTFQWKLQDVFICAETRPLVPGTKLILSHHNGQPGCRWIIEPAKGKPKFFRVLSADEPSLCWCADSLDSGSRVFLTDQRGDNTLITCEMNEDELRHGNGHYYKFEVSDLYLNISEPTERQPGGTEWIHHGRHVIQEFKRSNNLQSQWCLASGGTLLNMANRATGSLQGIYRELCDPVPNTFCICGQNFETVTALDEHRPKCPSGEPNQLYCGSCRTNIKSFGSKLFDYHSNKCNQGFTEMCSQCQSFFHKEAYDAHLPCTTPPPERPAGPSPEEKSTIAAAQKRCVALRKGCKGPVKGFMLVCNDCFQEKCIWCGGPAPFVGSHDAKPCTDCSTKKGGGSGINDTRIKTIVNGCASCFKCGKVKGSYKHFRVCQKCNSDVVRVALGCCYPLINAEVSYW